MNSIEKQVRDSVRVSVWGSVVRSMRIYFEEYMVDGINGLTDVSVRDYVSQNSVIYHDIIWHMVMFNSSFEIQ